MNLQTQLIALLRDAVISYTKAKNSSTFMQKGLDKKKKTSIHCHTEATKNAQ